MTDTDTLSSRLELVLARLEAMAGPPTAGQFAAVNPDGTPGNVAAGELIESAWGNSVADRIGDLWSVRIQGGTAVVSTNGAAAFALSFTAPYASPPFFASAWNSDISNPGYLVTINQPTMSAGGMDGVVYNVNTGVAAASALVRVQWIAFGVRA